VVVGGHCAGNALCTGNALFCATCLMFFWVLVSARFFVSTKLHFEGNFGRPEDLGQVHFQKIVQTSKGD
jgi:hypothetical protein